MIEATKPTLKERQWSLREDAILDAASELMSGKGYNAMTMDDVANLVGISKATLYLHFSSKHDLVVSVACRTLDRAYEGMREVDFNVPAGEQLAQLIERVVKARFGSDSPPFIEAVSELIEILGSDHPFMQKERRNIDFIAQVIQRAADAGSLIDGIANCVAVHMLLGTLRCIELEKAIEEGQTTTEEISSSLRHMLLKS